MFDIRVLRVEVPEPVQFLLKRPQRAEIVLWQAARLDLRVFEEGVNERLARALELPVRDSMSFRASSDIALNRSDHFAIQKVTTAHSPHFAHPMFLCFRHRRPRNCRCHPSPSYTRPRLPAVPRR